MENSRNLFLTIALSILILTLWQVFYMQPRVDAQREQQRIEAERAAATETQTQAPTGDAAAPTAAAQSDVPTPAADGTAAPAAPAAAAPASETATRRIAIDTPKLSGSINLTGARFDDLVLKDYRETVSKTSDNIHLLNPSGEANGYFAEVGFAGTAAGSTPWPQVEWQAAPDARLTVGNPVTLTFTSDAGVTFQRQIAVDEDYMFTVTDTVTNGSATAAALSPYGRVMRFEKPTGRSIYILHEGLIGVTGEEGLQEVKYGDLEEEREIKPGKSTDGWLGITDKYWAATLVPPETTPFQPRYSYFSDERPRYQADYLSDPLTVEPGQSATVTTELFAGAKVVEIVKRYEEERSIRQFDLVIDWGWFYFITKPMFWLIDNLYKLFGNFGLAILGATVVVKAFFYPLANKSYASMAKMKMVQPKMTEIREKYADDKMKQQQAMMELYKTEKINPVAGCWPVLLQIPVFFSLYKVLYVTIEMRHAPFFGWIQDLSAPDPTSLFNLFGLLPYSVPAALMIGVWPLIMGVTMFLQMQMNPTPPDPTQALIFKWMPIVFTFMLAAFPAGLVIYWAWNNTLSIIQQGIIMKRNGAKIELWDNLKSIFRRKPGPAE
ncbi:MAG: membrane protein insertase YidC [Brucellaceae bacterium]|nr:membrane protein insertase YidC [Brucellaceae bacterium]